MTEREKRIIIAEFLGATWQDVPPEEREWAKRYHPKRVLSFHKWDFTHPRCAPLPIPDPNTGDALDVPYYGEDLVAMHEAEKSLKTNEQQNRYQAEIADICWSDESRGDNQVVFNQLTATAKQRSEAFIKTIDKWK